MSYDEKKLLNFKELILKGAKEKAKKLEEESIAFEKEELKKIEENSNIRFFAVLLSYPLQRFKH